MFSITKEQVTGVVRLGLVLLTGWFSAHLNLGNGAANMIVAFAPTIGAIAWSLLAHSEEALIAAVASKAAVTSVITTPVIANSPKFVDNAKVVSVVKP